MYFGTAAAAYVVGEALGEHVGHNSEEQKLFLNAIPGSAAVGMVHGFARHSVASGVRASVIMAIGMTFSTYLLRDYETPAARWVSKRQAQVAALEK